MITGGCQCKAVRYSIGGDPVRSALCACADCRRSSGAPAVAWALFAREVMKVAGEPASYNSSGDVLRTFCANCGTGLFYQSDSILPGLVNVRTATMDESDGYPPSAWVQMADAPEWLHSIGDLPKFDRYSGR